MWILGSRYSIGYSSSAELGFRILRAKFPRFRTILCVLLVNVYHWEVAAVSFSQRFLHRRHRTQGLLNFIEIRVRNNFRHYLHRLKNHVSYLLRAGKMERILCLYWLPHLPCLVNDLYTDIFRFVIVML